MLSNTNRKDLAFVIWSIRELEDIKMFFSIIELHCEINQDIGNLHRASRVLGSHPSGEALQCFPPVTLRERCHESEPTCWEVWIKLERQGGPLRRESKKHTAQASPFHSPFFFFLKGDFPRRFQEVSLPNFSDFSCIDFCSSPPVITMFY